MDSGPVKVFCVGFNKTGTTTLHQWFTAAGLDSSHDATYQRRTRTMEREALRSYLDAHEAFSDGERANVPLLLDLYPEAKIILNTRPMRAWLESRIKHVFRWGGNALAPGAPGDPLRPGPHSGRMTSEYLRDPAQAISDWIDRREVHHRAVLHLLSGDRSRLLVVDVTTDREWSSDLRTFLGVAEGPREAVVPHAKASTADAARFDLGSRLAQIDVVLEQKAIPLAEWDNRVHIGFATS